MLAHDVPVGERGLTWPGYEVYRFSSYELGDDRAADTVREFFDRLLHRS